MTGGSKALIRGLAIVAVVALAITVMPRGGDVLDVALATLQAAFLAAIAAVGWRLYHARSFWLKTLSERSSQILYVTFAVAPLAVVAKGRFYSWGHLGKLAWIGVLAACGFAVYWVWQDSRRYPA